ncbi:competence type IV pilus minor pilin ComGF [Clostridium hydrogenum]|uniref:competence type IV pilus minor pilin ComGF n=1 Tax=Clostridium hydrogenum TaxID=2855764 RepID=UPI002E358E01|nr:competence type IV pilus minor pilin ComGF [Clostridium hydrogenum]
MNFYSKQIEIQNQDSYVSEGMLIMENLMNGGDVEIKNGAIAINKNSDEYNLIQFDKYSEKLIVDYYRYNIKLTSNNVMFKIKNFNIVRNNNLVYIFITCKDGRRYMRCFILKSQSNQASA